jgi:hypothetical protein
MKSPLTGLINVKSVPASLVLSTILDLRIGPSKTVVPMLFRPFDEKRKQ